MTNSNLHHAFELVKKVLMLALIKTLVYSGLLAFNKLVFDILHHFSSSKEFLLITKSHSFIIVPHGHQQVKHFA